MPEIPAPDISFVVTTYNASGFIVPTLRALLAQEAVDVQVVLCDDGSEDGTLDQLADIDDPRLVILQPGRVGRGNALNLAIQRAEAEIIAINDADDRSFPRRAVLLLESFAADNRVDLIATDFVSCNRFSARALPDVSSARPVLEPVDRLRIYRSNPFVHSTVAFRKALWMRLGGYDGTLRMCIDYEFFLRVSEVAQVAWMPVATIEFYKNPGSYFKRGRAREYLQVLRGIRRASRLRTRLPVYACVYDLLPWLEYGRARIRSARSRRVARGAGELVH